MIADERGAGVHAGGVNVDARAQLVELLPDGIERGVVKRDIADGRRQAD